MRGSKRYKSSIIESDQSTETGYVTDSSQSSRREVRPRAATIDERPAVNRRLTKSERDRRRSRRSSEFTIENDGLSESSADLNDDPGVAQNRPRKRASSKSSHADNSEQEVNPRYRKRAGSRRGSLPVAPHLNQQVDIKNLEKIKQGNMEETDDEEPKSICSDTKSLKSDCRKSLCGSTSTLKMNDKDIYFGTWRPGERAVLDQVLHNIDLKCDKNPKQKRAFSRNEIKPKKQNYKEKEYEQHAYLRVGYNAADIQMKATSCYVEQSSKPSRRSIKSLLVGIKKLGSKERKNEKKSETHQSFSSVKVEISEGDLHSCRNMCPPAEKKRSKAEVLKELFTRRKENPSSSSFSRGAWARATTNTPSLNSGRPRTSSMNHPIATLQEARVRSSSMNESIRNKVIHAPDVADKQEVNAAVKRFQKPCSGIKSSMPLGQDAGNISQIERIGKLNEAKGQLRESKLNLSNRRSASIRSIPDQLRNAFKRTKSVDNFNGAFQFYANKGCLFQRTPSICSLSGKSKKFVSSEKLVPTKRCVSQYSIGNDFEPAQFSAKELGFDESEGLVFAKASCIQPQVATSNKISKRFHKHEHPLGSYDSAYEDEMSGYQSEVSRAPSVISAFPAFNRQISEDYSVRARFSMSAWSQLHEGEGPYPQASNGRRITGYQSGYNSESDHALPTLTSATPNVARRAIQRSVSKQSSLSSYLSESSFIDENDDFVSAGPISPQLRTPMLTPQNPSTPKLVRTPAIIAMERASGAHFTRQLDNNFPNKTLVTLL